MSLLVNVSTGAWTADGQSLTIGGTPGSSVSGVTFALVFWFRCSSNSGGSNFANIYGEGITTDTSKLDLQLRTTGAIAMFYRPQNGSTSMTITSGTGYDDGRWHWVFASRTANNAHALYIDGVSVGTDSTSITTTYDAGTDRILSGNPGFSQQIPVGGHLGPYWGFRRAMTVDQVRRVAYGQPSPLAPAFFLDGRSIQQGNSQLGGPAMSYTSVSGLTPTMFIPPLWQPYRNPWPRPSVKVA